MKIDAKFDREKIWYRGDSVRYLVVRVTDPGDARPATPAGLNLCLVIDASGSMAGQSLQFAMASAQRIIAALSDQDYLSIVSFNSEVTDHVTSLQMTPEGRVGALQALAGIQADGMTDLSSGWLRGAEHVARGMSSGRPLQHRVIVLSDGHANEGIVEPEVLARHAGELALRGLFSSTVGIGDDYNSETLEAIAVHGGGTHHRAARPHEIVEVVTAELQAIRLAVAENITVTVRHAPGSRLKCLNAFPLTHQDDEYVCNLGCLAAGASRTAVFSVKFPAGKVGETLPFEIRATWRRPGADDVFSSESCSLTTECAVGKDNDAQPFDASLTETVAQVWQAYIVRRIVRLNREGRYVEAVKRLDHDLFLFSKYAQNAVNGPSLIDQLKRLREVASQAWSEGSRKEVEVAMYSRTHSVADARRARRASWLQYAAQTASTTDEDIHD